MELDRKNAETLKAFLASGLADPLHGLHAEKCTVLWVVDRGGRIFFATEEWLPDQNPDAIATAEPKSRLPRQRFSGPFLKTPKLGHPSLVGGKSARNGGEILLEFRKDGRPYWEINNRSGRFGKGRTESQLHNVVDEFRKFGVNLNPRYY